MLEEDGAEVAGGPAIAADPCPWRRDGAVDRQPSPSWSSSVVVHGMLEEDAAEVTGSPVMAADPCPWRRYGAVEHLPTPSWRLEHGIWSGAQQAPD
jgi:hypothetical protein